MAFSFGSQVNPALLRSDFGSILQGGAAGAQSIERGGAAMGQAYANVGQNIGAAIEKYTETKKQTDVLQGQNAALIAQMKSDAGFGAKVSKNEDVVKMIEKFAKDGGGGYNQAAKLNAALTSTYGMHQKDVEQQRQQVHAQLAQESINKMRDELAETQRLRQVDQAVGKAISGLDPRSPEAAQKIADFVTQAGGGASAISKIAQTWGDVVDLSLVGEKLKENEARVASIKAQTAETQQRTGILQAMARGEVTKINAGGRDVWLLADGRPLPDADGKIGQYADDFAAAQKLFATGEPDKVQQARFMVAKMITPPGIPVELAAADSLLGGRNQPVAQPPPSSLSVKDSGQSFMMRLMKSNDGQQMPTIGQGFTAGGGTNSNLRPPPTPPPPPDSSGITIVNPPAGPSMGPAPDFSVTPTSKATISAVLEKLLAERPNPKAKLNPQSPLDAQIIRMQERLSSARGR